MKIFCTILVLCLLLTTCAMQTSTETYAPAISDTAVNGTEVSTEPNNTPKLTFTLYAGNENADGFTTTNVEVPQITWEIVLEHMIQANVLPDGVQILSFSAEGSMLKIDFNQAFCDHLCTMGTSGELILIGSVVNTFLDAFEAESIFLTAEGGIIESGHVIYDEPLTQVNLP